MFLLPLSSLLLSFVLLFALRRLAVSIHLVDIPNHCKKHEGEVPVIGGIAIYFAVFFSSLLFTDVDHTQWVYFLCGAILVVVGVIDDKFDISVRVRMLIQVITSLVIIFSVDISLVCLGNIVGEGHVDIDGWVSYFVTVIAIVGAINAFNMVDGIDGLLGGLASVTFTALGLMFFLQGNATLAMICLMYIAALVPYVLLNLGIPFGQRYKIFMGDAGSMLLGFTVVWLLILASQPSHEDVINPVTALWFIALPLMDMATIMVRRVRKGQSPFKPDREHLHHICQRIGLSSRMTLVFICSLASFFAAIGVFGELYAISETMMFMAFLVLFAVYFSVISHIFRITTKVRAMLGKSPLSEEIA
ncbi:UDP-N-acetylglucosamine--undecaprenyl-phosphate N-acetylglucosaminephosphotransferase [Enterovibrio norvegicus]|uniref:UDP-N-acetylglucosamine--undecaprenyl-phosphate N-acetylglucosaminephosphotransferase n=1 Tax=Enterovibrio norvegicus TaxID=188144 RepID=UPI00352E1CB6